RHRLVLRWRLRPASRRCSGLHWRMSRRSPPRAIRRRSAACLPCRPNAGERPPCGFRSGSGRSRLSLHGLLSALRQRIKIVSGTYQFLGQRRGPLEGEFDYVIVGAGSAGCVLAARLTEDPGTRVLLLEAGGGADKFLIRMPLG